MNIRRISVGPQSARAFRLHSLATERAGEDGERLVPLINVVFLLMVFFLLAGSISKRDALPIEPPESVSEQIRLPKARQLLVLPDGQLLLDGTNTRLNDLPNLRLQRVEILTDAQMDVGRLRPVLATLQSAGVKQISLLTRRP